METPRPRRTYQNHLLLGVVLAFIVGGFILMTKSEYGIHRNVPLGSGEASSTAALPIEGPLLAEALPTSLSIPKLSIETTFTAPLGLDKSGALEVPGGYEEVGWYKNSPTPGELGPSVILGHVDSYEGPAVFFSLGQLVAGDDIFITRADGSVAHFQVVTLERYEQVEFPTAKVYGDINFAGLRVITCSGTYQKGVQRYTHNLVVYAKLVE